MKNIKKFSEYNESFFSNLFKKKEKEEPTPLKEYKPKPKRKGCYCADCGEDCEPSNNNCLKCDSQNIINSNEYVPKKMYSGPSKKPVKFAPSKRKD